MANSNLSAFIQWLQGRHDEIMACESAALEMMRKNNVEGYREKIREKAQMLAQLAEEASSVLNNKPTGENSRIENTLENFSRNAQMSLQLDSIFYMSALLYKDDHKKDEPDNLQLFINELKQIDA